MIDFQPGYINLYYSEELKKRIDKAYSKLKKCDLCPRKCLIDRHRFFGICKVRDNIKVSAFVIYKGEEPPLVGNTGAGGVFFSGCALRCVYCQNFRFSQLAYGKIYTVEELANNFLMLQNEKKVVNLDLVTATPYIPFILDALSIAVERGFRLPIVWNTIAYENIETLKLLENIVDIYLPDIRYVDDEIAYKYSGVKDYWKVAQKAIIEMYNQVGTDWIVDENGVLKRGLIIRILVIPNNIDQAKKAIDFISALDKNIHISIMDQYVPVYKASKYPEINRYLTQKEYDEVVDYALQKGLEYGWIQEHELPLL